MTSRGTVTALSANVSQIRAAEGEREGVFSLEELLAKN